MLRLQKIVLKFCHINRVGQYFRFSLATRGQRRQWGRKERDVFLSLILVIASQPFPSSSYLNNVSDTRNTRLYTFYTTVQVLHENLTIAQLLQCFQL